MKTRLIKLSALVLALLLTLSGCSLIEINQEMDYAEVVAEVGGTKITKGEVINDYAYQLAYYTYLYSSYGLSMTDDLVAEVKDSLLDTYIERELMRQKAVELGLSDLSDEAFAEADEEAAATFEEQIETYLDQVSTDAMTDEEAREATAAYLEQNGITLDTIKADARAAQLSSLVRDSVIADIAVSEEDLQAKYDAKVAEDETTYSGSSYLFELNNTSEDYTITWMPEGYRTVKHILFRLSNEQTAALNEINTELDNVAHSIDALENPDAHEGHDHETEEAAEDAEPALTLDELNAKKAELEQQLADMQAEVLASFEEQTAAVYARLEAGESFDALMDELGQDPDMQTEPSRTNGYYVSAESSYWAIEFRDAAMALEKIGDVSEPVLTSSGVHIVYYNSDVTPGAVGLDAVRDALSKELLTEKQDEAFTAQIDEWKQAANAKKYPRVLG